MFPQQRHASGPLAIFGAVLALMAASAMPVAAQDLTQECANDDVGYSVGFPKGWYYNEFVEGGELEDVAACRFFSPQDFEVQPQAGIAGMAIAIGPEADGPDGALTPDTTVGGKPAYITETTVEEDGFEPAGTRHYDYWIELGPDTWLVAGTSDAPNFVGDYDENKALLDAMMDSLRFGRSDDGGVPDTRVAAPVASLPAFLGLLLLAAAGLAVMRRSGANR
jgi:hypothetical protein